MPWQLHGYKVGNNEQWFNQIPQDTDELAKFTNSARKHIEPWLSAVLQSEHLNLLIGSGFTSAISHLAHANAANMGAINFQSDFDAQINSHATESARRMGRGQANIEDQFRSALMVLDGLKVIGTQQQKESLEVAIDRALHTFLVSILATEQGINGADDDSWSKAVSVLQSFLLSFASRSASRERLHIFTTNYERLIEYGCDLAGIRLIDRFVGALNPIFRSTRVDVDMHYNPPGIRGEPRFMEGVVRLTKLHGSIDWHLDKRTRQIRKIVIPFGAGTTHTDVPAHPLETVMIYPNPAKDVETTAYPYAELFRDFASSLCRPNSVVIVYGYGFGDDHINRVLTDMLSIPSTHMVLISYGRDIASFERAQAFYNRSARPAQISFLVGSHFANLPDLVTHYLPKPSIDFITGRMAELLKSRPQEDLIGDVSIPQPPFQVPEPPQLIIPPPPNIVPPPPGDDPF